MIDPKRKAFRDEDFNSDPRANAKPESIGYDVGQKFDEAGLPNPYIEDHDQVDMDNDDRDGRGIPTSFAITTTNDTTTADNTADDDTPSNSTDDADVASGE